MFTYSVENGKVVKTIVEKSAQEIALEAVAESIRKWEFIRLHLAPKDGTYVIDDGHQRTCGLCDAYYDFDGCGRCGACPIFKDTHADGCTETPYPEYTRAVGHQNSYDSYVAAGKMVDYLSGLYAKIQDGEL